MPYTWGPLRGGNTQEVLDHYISCDESGAQRLLNLFEDWRREDRKNPDAFTLQASTSAMSIGLAADNARSKITGVSFQSSDGGGDNALMHIHRDGEPMIIFLNITVQKDFLGRIAVKQMVAPGA